MKQLPPTIRKRIIDLWLSGTLSERQIAEQFNISKTLVAEIVGEHNDKAALKPVDPRTLNMARELYAAMPVEIAGRFSDRFESIVSASRALLMTPSL